jgi:hypothetical protein
MKPYPAEEMTYYQVSPIVSKAENDVAECVKEVPDTIRPGTQASFVD